MAIKREDEYESTGGKAVYPIRCPECGHDARAAGWTSGPIVHCKGASEDTFGIWAIAEHHGHKFIFCPGPCRRQLGCDSCVKPSRAFCERCRLFVDGEPIAGSTEESKARIRALIADCLKDMGGWRGGSKSI